MFSIGRGMSSGRKLSIGRKKKSGGFGLICGFRARNINATDPSMPRPRCGMGGSVILQCRNKQGYTDQNWDLSMLADIWLVWGFQINFMYDDVL